MPYVQHVQCVFNVDLPDPFAKWQYPIQCSILARGWGLRFEESCARPLLTKPATSYAISSSWNAWFILVTRIGQQKRCLFCSQFYRSHLLLGIQGAAIEDPKQRFLVETLYLGFYRLHVCYAVAVG